MTQAATFPIAVRATSLCKRFNGPVVALDDFSLEVEVGEVFGILGPNGAGKTTFMSIVQGLFPQDSGELVVLGHARVGANLKRMIGVQQQSTTLIPGLTLCEQLQLFANLYGLAWQKSDAIGLLERVDLVEKKDVYHEQLSGGQLQRLCLAIALVNDPSLIILDEPTTGLDPQARQNLWELVRSLRRADRTFIVTTHYMEEAEALCSRVAVVDKGRVLAVGKPAGLVASVGGSAELVVDSDLDEPALLGLAGVAGACRRAGEQIVEVNDADVATRAILSEAQRRGMHVREIRPKRKNLEDVFLELTGRKLRD